MQSGEDYGKLKKSIVVSFIDGVIFPELTGCHSIFQLLEKDSGCLLSDRLSIHFVELGKIETDRPAAELTPVERLAAYIRYAGDETCADYIEEILSEEEDLMMAETLYRKLTQEEIAYEEMESMRRAEFARNTELRYAREEGEAIGESRGKQEGIIIGQEAGQNLFAALTAKLLADGRIDDLKQAAEDADFRAALFEEYDIR